jgi:hypothetical protein
MTLLQIAEDEDDLVQPEGDLYSDERPPTSTM